jgi:predicted Zn-dependent protease
MTNTAKKAAIVAEAETAKTAEVLTPVLRVSKPEPEKEPEPEKKPVSVSDVKASVYERFNLAEKHERLTTQLADLKNFEANISHDASVRLETGTGRIYRSNDPGAVKRQILYCVESIQTQIREVEALLLA